MSIGTTEGIEQTHPALEVESSQFGGGDGGGRKGKGGDGGSGRFHPFGIMDKSNERLKLVTWFIMLAVMMTFVGLIGAYVFVSTNKVIEWNPFNLPTQMWVSTALLLASSAAYALSHKTRSSGNQGAAKTWLMVTTALGAIFIASQILSWLALYGAGYYMRSNPYAGFFYFITALHAVHVIGGICALGYMVLRSWVPTDSANELDRRLAASRSVGQYWHFMDALWVVLVLMFALWK